MHCCKFGVSFAWFDSNVNELLQSECVFQTSRCQASAFSSTCLCNLWFAEQTCSSLMRATSCMMSSVFSLRRAIAQYHQTICEVPSHFQYFQFKLYIYVSHRPFNDVNASLFMCLHGCAIACA